MTIFENLGEEKAKELFKRFKAKGMSDDDAYNELYRIECSLDTPDEIGEIEDVMYACNVGEFEFLQSQ